MSYKLNNDDPIDTILQHLSIDMWTVIELTKLGVDYDGISKCISRIDRTLKSLISRNLITLSYGTDELVPTITLSKEYEDKLYYRDPTRSGCTPPVGLLFSGSTTVPICDSEEEVLRMIWDGKTCKEICTEYNHGTSSLLGLVFGEIISIIRDPIHGVWDAAINATTNAKLKEYYRYVESDSSEEQSSVLSEDSTPTEGSLGAIVESTFPGENLLGQDKPGEPVVESKPSTSSESTLPGMADMKGLRAPAMMSPPHPVKDKEPELTTHVTEISSNMIYCNLNLHAFDRTVSDKIVIEVVEETLRHLSGNTELGVKVMLNPLGTIMMQSFDVKALGLYNSHMNNCNMSYWFNSVLAQNDGKLWYALVAAELK